jgi:hypothetical protein
MSSSVPHATPQPRTSPFSFTTSSANAAPSSEVTPQPRRSFGFTKSSNSETSTSEFSPGGAGSAAGSFSLKSRFARPPSGFTHSFARLKQARRPRAEKELDTTESEPNRTGDIVGNKQFKRPASQSRPSMAAPYGASRGANVSINDGGSSSSSSSGGGGGAGGSGGGSDGVGGSAGRQQRAASPRNSRSEQQAQINIDESKAQINSFEEGVSGIRKFGLKTMKELATSKEKMDQLQIKIAQLHYDCITTNTPELVEFIAQQAEEARNPQEDGDDDEEMDA